MQNRNRTLQIVLIFINPVHYFLCKKKNGVTVLLKFQVEQVLLSK